MLQGKEILLGVTGGIAAYKSAELVRLLVQEGCAVRVMMTGAAQKFITPLTMKTLSGQPVHTALFADEGEMATPHIKLAREPQMIVVAPATANILGKVASGIADDLLSTVLMAVELEKCPVLLAPAMNSSMLNNPAVKHNMELLRQRGFFIAHPNDGFLACGETGTGRMVEPSALLQLIKKRLVPREDYRGLIVLVTAGPTREALDPVRFISNHSSGRMGYALARAAVERGAGVFLVSGPVALKAPPGVELINVNSAREMFNAVMDRLPLTHVVIKAAAVSDFTPVKTWEQKMKKGEDEGMTLQLVRNPDILKEIGRQKGKCCLVGFAAETEQLTKNALQKLEEKNLDMIVANDLTLKGAGFGVETNIVKIFYKDGRREDLPQMSKYDLAHHILDSVQSCRNKQ